jgi:hypothetical protein
MSVFVYVCDIQEGGKALVNLLFGAQSPSGRLPITWYSSSYVDAASPLNLNMRPDDASGYPGRSYRCVGGGGVTGGGAARGASWGWGLRVCLGPKGGGDSSSLLHRGGGGYQAHRGVFTALSGHVCMMCVTFQVPQGPPARALPIWLRPLLHNLHIQRPARPNPGTHKQHCFLQYTTLLPFLYVVCHLAGS